MVRWLIMLGGLVVWLIHFLGVYAIASAADVWRQADAPPAIWTIIGFTLACAAANVAIAAAALPRMRRAGDSLDRFMFGGGAFNAGLSFVAVLWQGLPAIMGG